MSGIPQGSVLALVILIVFITEMIDGAERAAKFTQGKKHGGGCRHLGRQD